MFAQIVLVKVTLVWSMFPTASCLPLTVVLFLSGVDSATSSGFRPDAALARVTSDDMSNAIWAVDLEQEGACFACFACVVFDKTSCVVMLCFSGSHWRRAEPVGRDSETKLGQDMAAPITVF